MNGEALFLQQQNALRREGGYRVFADLERRTGQFPRNPPTWARSARDHPFIMPVTISGESRDPRCDGVHRNPPSSVAEVASVLHRHARCAQAIDLELALLIEEAQIDPFERQLAARFLASDRSVVPC